MIKIDLYLDWIEYQRECLQEFGYPVATLSDPSQISIAYFNAIKRRIPTRIRNIFKSDVFLCPGDLAEGLKILESKIQSGHDINPNLSRGLKRVNYNDYLLNDWGIFHFHLGSEIESDGYVERTGPVLFSFITHDSFHEIHVYNHGNWSNTDLIEIVHRNWPHLLEKFRMENVIQLSHIPDSATVKEFRKIKINSFIQVEDGTVYSQPGFGYSTNGTAVDVSVSTIRYKKFMDRLQKLVIENLADEIENELQKLGHKKGGNIELKLLIENGWAYVSCEQHNIKFKLHSMNIA